MADGVYLWHPRTNETITLTKDEFVIGTDPEKADYVIRDNRYISPVHAVIILRDGKYYLRDNRSNNGTYLNVQRVIPGTDRLLADGDRISLDAELLLFNARLGTGNPAGSQENTQSGIAKSVPVQRELPSEDWIRPIPKSERITLWHLMWKCNSKRVAIWKEQRKIMRAFREQEKQRKRAGM